MAQIKNIVFNEIDVSNYMKLEKFIQKNLQSYSKHENFFRKPITFVDQTPKREYR